MAQPHTPPIIVLGAPRSGTSLIAGSLHNCGISMGSDFLESDQGNPNGYFEDLDFIHFHQALLARSTGSVNRLFDDSTMREQAFDFEAQAKDIETAQALIQSRNTQQALWGWKDPRTCLFLPFWHKLLPDARYIITYKHPLEMSASLLRMRKNWDLLLDPEMAVRSWTFYMSETLKFIQTIPKEQYFIANAGALIHDTTALAKCLQKWNVALDEPTALTAHIVPTLITKTKLSLTIQSQFAQYFPQAAKVFESLQSASMQAMEWLPASTNDTITTATKDALLDSKTALAYLQNQIQAEVADKNNQARDDLGQQITKVIHFRFAHEKELEHQIHALARTHEKEVKEQKQQLEAAHKKVFDQQTHTIQDLAKRLAQVQQLHEITQSTPLPTPCCDIFGRPCPAQTVGSSIQKWQLKRATGNNWAQLNKKIRTNQIWVVDLFSLLAGSQKQNENPLQQHWEEISQDISKMGHLGIVSAQTSYKVFTEIQSSYYQANPLTPVIPLAGTYQELAARFKMTSDKANEWTEHRVRVLADKFQAPKEFEAWLDCLESKGGRWICSGFHGFTSAALAEFTQRLKLAPPPSEYLYNEALSNNAPAAIYFEHWQNQLKLKNWAKIAWLGSSTVRDFYWPKQSGIQNCYVMETQADSLPDSPTAR